MVRNDTLVLDIRQAADRHQIFVVLVQGGDFFAQLFNVTISKLQLFAPFFELLASILHF